MVPPAPPLQPVFCEGPVEGIVSQLLASLAASLCLQLSSAVLRHLTPALPPGRAPPPYPALSNLPALWGSALSTQIVVLATQIALELSLASAVQESTGGRDPFDDLSVALNSLVTTATQILQGRALVDVSSGEPADEGAWQAGGGQSDSLARLESHAVFRASASSVPRGENSPSNAGSPHPRPQADGLVGHPPHPPSPDHVNRFQTIILILASFGGKLASLASLAREGGGEISGSFQWQSLVHVHWEAAEKRCSFATLGATLPYGFAYVGGGGRIMVTPVMERGLLFLLQAVSEGTHPLLLGEEVSGAGILLVHADQCSHITSTSAQF